MLPLGPADLDETAALYGDPEVMRYIASGVEDRASTAAILDRVAATWKKHGFGLWAIRDATTGAFLGEGGLQPMPDLTAPATVVAAVDFGYTFCRRSWGHGYAGEAGAAILNDAWTRFDGPEVHALVTTDNIASQKVLRKLGFKKGPRITHHERAHQLWAATRPG